MEIFLAFSIMSKSTLSKGGPRRMVNMRSPPSSMAKRPPLNGIWIGEDGLMGIISQL